MPYTFGAASGDDASFTAIQALPTNNAVHFVSGWWRPTTLTATRKYIANNNGDGLRVGATTSEIEFFISHVTTSSVWTTSGAGIDVDKWWFIAAILSATNTGPAEEVIIWIGDLETPPVAVSITQTTSPVGNLSGNSAIAAGNSGSSGTTAFQGDISNVFWISHPSDQSAANMFGKALSGTFSAEEEEYILRRFVLPLWRNNNPEGLFIARSLSAGGIALLFGSNEGGGQVFAGNSASLLLTPHTVTVTGATVSQMGVPKPMMNPIFSGTFIRR